MLNLHHVHLLMKKHAFEISHNQGSDIYGWKKVQKYALIHMHVTRPVSEVS